MTMNPKEKANFVTLIGLALMISAVIPSMVCILGTVEIPSFLFGMFYVGFISLSYGLGATDMHAMMTKKHYGSGWYATVKMTKPYKDVWGFKPSTDIVLECLADLIRDGQLDDYFQIEVAQVR